MAVQAATLQPALNINLVRYKWAALANGDTGAPVQCAGSVNLMVKTGGTFGAGGTCTWQGSTDNFVTSFTLSDTAVAAIAPTAAGQKMVIETPLYVRPNITAGDGTTAITAECVMQFLPG